jgi:hypothetical protein
MCSRGVLELFRPERREDSGTIPCRQSFFGNTVRTGRDEEDKEWNPENDPFENSVVSQILKLALSSRVLARI